MPIKSLVMLATFEIVPGTKSIELEISALPVAPIHVPDLSETRREIPGNPLCLYFSIRFLINDIYSTLTGFEKPFGVLSMNYVDRNI